MVDRSPEALLSLLLWVLAGLTCQFMLVVALGGWLQVKKNRHNAMRIACSQRWEDGLVRLLYGDGSDEAFLGMGRAEKRLVIPFLLKALATLAGTEGEAVRALYQHLGLAQDLHRRLASRQPNLRAMAAMEVGTFRVEAAYPQLLVLLRDPVPRVAHAAARSLAATGDLAFAGPVLAWVKQESRYQQERLLWILEAFGLAFLPWLEARLEANPDPDPQDRILYALMAAALRFLQDSGPLEAMLRTGNPERQTAALKALGAIGNPEALPSVVPFARSEYWVHRGQAARAIGALAGTSAIPLLLHLLADPVFNVRRKAAKALAQLGPAGREALLWVAQDRTADPFARDLARERLHWLPEARPA